MRVCIGGPLTRARYAKAFNAVDRNDRDSADYSTSIRTNRYYIRIFCWVLDHVVHVVFAMVLYCCQLEICPKDWKRYQSKNNGRHDLQIDLGIAILNHAIALDWDGDKRPDYIQETSILAIVRSFIFASTATLLISPTQARNVQPRRWYTNMVHKQRQRSVVLFA